MRQVVANAVASVAGRRASAVGIVAIAVALMAGLLAVVTPLRDGRVNLLEHYQRGESADTWLIGGSTAALTRARAELLVLPGVRSVETLSTDSAFIGDAPLEVQTYDEIYAADVVEGRAPRPEACEAVVTRDVSGVHVGDSVTVAFEPSTEDASSRATPLTTTVVGVLAEGNPLVSNGLVTTCDLTAHGIAPNALLVHTSDGSPIPARFHADRLSDVARTNLRAVSATGVLGLVTLLLALVALTVTASVGRWAVRSRRSEFACLRVWGYSRRAIALQIGVEMLILWLVALPLGVLLGGLLAWQFMVRVGDVVDRTAGPWIAVPSSNTVALVAGGLGVALVVLSVLPAAGALRPSVASLLRRRGE